MANIEKNTRRYHRIFSKAVDDILPAPTDASLPSDIFDVLATQVCIQALCWCSKAPHSKRPEPSFLLLQRAQLSQRRREDAATQERDADGELPVRRSVHQLLALLSVDSIS